MEWRRKEKMKKLSLLIVIIVLFNGCYLFDGSTRFNHLDKQKEQKLNFINQLIFNSESYDSLLHNSEFYHPEISKEMDSEKSEISRMMKQIKPYLNNKYYIDDIISLYPEGQYIHDIAILFDTENIKYNENVLSVYFEKEKDNWYISMILKGNWRLEKYGFKKNKE